MPRKPRMATTKDDSSDDEYHSDELDDSPDEDEAREATDAPEGDDKAQRVEICRLFSFDKGKTWNRVRPEQLAKAEELFRLEKINRRIMYGGTASPYTVETPPGKPEKPRKPVARRVSKDPLPVKDKQDKYKKPDKSEKSKGKRRHHRQATVGSDPQKLMDTEFYVRCEKQGFIKLSEITDIAALDALFVKQRNGIIASRNPHCKTRMNKRDFITLFGTAGRKWHALQACDQTNQHSRRKATQTTESEDGKPGKTGKPEDPGHLE
jgi:hypothetical protein